MTVLTRLPEGRIPLKILADYKRFMLCVFVWFIFQLIKLNSPDLVLFVGEALVGNEAVDQLKKFNQALADFSMAENPRLIDGILLTKFDTIDDKVSCVILEEVLSKSVFHSASWLALVNNVSRFVYM